MNPGQPETTALPNDVVEAAGLPPGAGTAGPDYDPRLTNEDLAPLKKQTWSSYNIFAFWMSDVHSVGGYVTAGSLFALGIASWQVLVALVVGIVIVQVFCNLVAKPSQKTGVPYPVINRAVFGVLGANIPAIIRGLIAVAWYGVQTFLAAEALNIIFLKFIPSSAALLETSFLGLSTLGWISYAILWVAQAALFWRGMESIRKFIDWAGPAVYVVMIMLAIYLVSEAGWSNISFSLSLRSAHGLLGLDPGDARGDRAGGVVLLGPDAELRRLRPVRQELRGGEEGQLPGPAAELPLLLAAHRHLRVRHGPGVRRADHRPDPHGRADRHPVRHPAGRPDVRHRDGRHQHRRQLHLARVRLLQRLPAEDQLAHGRHDRGGRLGAADPVELVLQRDRDPLHARRPRCADRPAVRHPHRRLLRDRQAAGARGRHVHHVHRRASTGTRAATTATRWPR